MVQILSEPQEEDRILKCVGEADLPYQTAASHSLTDEPVVKNRPVPFDPPSKTAPASLPRSTHSDSQSIH